MMHRFRSKHANFIVNQGHASAADVLSLIKKVRARIAQKDGDQIGAGIENRGRSVAKGNSRDDGSTDTCPDRRTHGRTIF